MKIFFIILFLLFPLGQLIKIPVFGRVSVLPQELIMLGGFLFWVVKEGKKVYATPLFKQIAIFAFVAILSLILNPLHLKSIELIESSLYLVRFLLYFAVFGMAFSGSEKGSITKKFLTSGLIFSVLATGMLGILQYIFYPGIANLAYLGWDIHYGRLVGTFFDPGFTGLIFILGFFLLLESDSGQVLRPRAQDRGARMTYGVILKYVGAVLFLICLLLTYSRSSYLALVFGLGIYSFSTKNIKLFIVITGIFLLGIFLIPKPVGEGGNLARTASSLARFDNWQQSLKIWQDHPLLGIGFNSYRFAREKYGYLPPNRPETVLSGQGELVNHSLSGADNSFLLVLAASGVLGLIIFLNIWRKAILSLNNEYKTVVLASFGAIFIHTIFQNALFYPHILEWIWILMAIGVHPSASSGSR